MGEQGDRKNIRTFQCRDYLFKVFDRMGADLDCSVDYLINEAMREYARKRDYAVAELAPSRAMEATTGVPAEPIAAPPQPEPRPAPALTSVPPPSSATPPPLPGQRISAAADLRRVLYVLFNGQRIPIDKDEFIIGRGARTADLAIRDGNISRRHCAVVFHEGGYFMKDLGSTNGIEFAGRRVESKRIEEGDVYRICDYELRFSFQ